MKDNLTILFAGAGDVDKKDGIITSLRKVLAFLLVFEHFTCYVYKSTLIRRNEADFLPGVKEFTFKIVSTRQELNELTSRGFDLSRHAARAKYRLEKGATACLIFVGKELASMEWVATNAKAKASIDDYPCKVDFSDKEAYAGGVWTNPDYRGKGLHLYAYYKIYDFLRQNGIVTVRSIVEVNNVAALKAHTRFSPEERMVARARYLRIAGLHFWKESSLPQ